MSTNGSQEYPVVVASNDKTVTLSFNVNGAGKRVEVNKTMLKGFGKWCARRLEKEGASVPEYGTKEMKDWAAGLRRAAGM
jgi:hypothetical protein